MARITFVYPDFESLGVEYLMALCIVNGHEVDFVYYESEDISLNKRRITSFETIAKKIAATLPHIVAFSCVTDNYQSQLNCAKTVKRLFPNVVTVFGGIHATAVPEIVLKNKEVDCIAIGESEQSFLNFLTQCKFNTSCFLPDNPVKGIVFRKNGVVIGKFEEGELTDLNSLPFPHKKPFYSAVKVFSNIYMIITSRGCPYHCSYCFNSFFLKLRGTATIRRRTVDNVISELLWAKEQFSPRNIIFLDDSFSTDTKWINEFCDRYKEYINLPFACIAIPQYINKDKAERLSRAGCIDMQIGVQSIAEKQICEKILHRKSSNKRIGEVIQVLKDVGITVQVDHMLGIPEDTVKIQEDSILFYNRYRPNRISVFWLTYYPGTPIVEIAKQRGILGDDDINIINEGKRLTENSSYTGGSIKNPKPYYSIAFILHYLPLLPKFIVILLIQSRLYKIFAIKNFILSTALPRAIQSVIDRKDFRGRSHILRFIYKLWPSYKRFLTGKKCPFCETGVLLPYFVLKKNYLETQRCTHCKMVVVSNSPIDSSNISDFYTMDAFKGKRKLDSSGLYQNYYSNCLAGYNHKNFTIVQFKKILYDIEYIYGINKNKPQKLLDIGCATGVFLDVAHNAGYTVKGVEISEELSDYARKNFDLEVENNLIEAAFPSDEFDIVSLLDVIEHFPLTIFDSMIKEIFRVLKPGGVLIIRTPSEDALLRRVAKILFFSSFKIIEFPMHLFYSYEHILNFTPISIMNSFKKHGFKLAFQRREEENPERLNISDLNKLVLHCFYLFSALLNKQHKMVQYYIKGFDSP